MRTFTVLSLASLILVVGCSGGGGLPPSQNAPQGQPSVRSNGGISEAIRRTYSQYKLVDLGANFAPSRVNSKNHVAGTLGQGESSLAAVYENGKVTAFPRSTGQFLSRAWDINDNDMVVGEVDFTGPCQHAALFHTASPPTLYYECAYGAASLATGINNAGEIVGLATPGGCDQTAIFKGGSTTLLSSDGDGEPVSVNKGGTIASSVFDSGVGACQGGDFIPVEYNPSATIQLPSDATPPYSPANNGGGWSTDINDAGTVIGTYYTCPTTSNNACGLVGFIYSSGTTVPVYEPNVAKTSACVMLNGLNNAGDVVGAMGVGYSVACGSSVALIVRGTKPTDLNTLIAGHPHWHLSSAADINDSGVIVGSGTKSGVQHGFMLMPKFCPLPVRR